MEEKKIETNLTKNFSPSPTLQTFLPRCKIYILCCCCLNFDGCPCLFNLWMTAKFQKYITRESKKYESYLITRGKMAQTNLYKYLYIYF
jgi:hypothetical protein